jgi:membrane-associated phospholipid phosphatase
MYSAFDSFFIGLMAKYARTSGIFDKFITQFLELHSVKTLPLITILWLLWFSKRSKLQWATIEALLGMFGALVISRIIQDVSPERPRPLHSGNPDFVLPFGVESTNLENWSSFPSDHAALVFAFSTAVWCANRRLGAACYVWSVLVVCLPRMYAGYHYASDILGGAVVGVLATLAVAYSHTLRDRLMPRILTLEERYAPLFYATFFIISFQFADLFDDVRRVGHGLSEVFT